jgi:hypothetical protein
VGTLGPAVHEFSYLLDQPFDINNGMTLKDPGKTVGQAAHEAFPRSLLKTKLKFQAIMAALAKLQADIKRTLFRITENGGEKSIGPLPGEKGFQNIVGKKVSEFVLSHMTPLSAFRSKRKTWAVICKKLKLFYYPGPMIVNVNPACKRSDFPEMKGLWIGEHLLPRYGIP